MHKLYRRKYGPRGNKRLVIKRCQGRQVGKAGRAFVLKRINGFFHMGIAPNATLQPPHLFERIVSAVVTCLVQRLFGAPNGHRRLVGDLFGSLHGGS